MQEFRRFSIEKSIIMLVDHQTMTIDWVKSLPKETTIAGCRVLTRMALDTPDGQKAQKILADEVISKL